MRWAALSFAALALVGCARAGTDALRENGTEQRLVYAAQAPGLAACLTAKLDEDDLAGVKVTRSLTLPNGDIQLQGKHHSAAHLIWTATLTQTAPNATQVDLITRNWAFIDMSGEAVAAHIKGALQSCSR